MNVYSKKRRLISALVKRFRKGDEAAQAELQQLLVDPANMAVFSKLFAESNEAKGLRMARAKNERIFYKSGGAKPLRGGAPGLGKR